MVALDPYAAVMAFDDIPDDGKTQAASLVFGTEERIKDFFQVFFTNAPPSSSMATK